MWAPSKIFRKMPLWVTGIVCASIPVGTYSWIVVTRPNIYAQLAEEIKRQEEADKAKRGIAA